MKKTILAITLSLFLCSCYASGTSNGRNTSASIMTNIFTMQF